MRMMVTFTALLMLGLWFNTPASKAADLFTELSRVLLLQDVPERPAPPPPPAAPPQPRLRTPRPAPLDDAPANDAPDRVDSERVPQAPPRAARPPRPAPPGPWGPILRRIEQDDPDLAARLRELDRRHPGILVEILANALRPRLPEAVAQAEAEVAAAPGPDRRPGGRPPGAPPEHWRHHDAGGPAHPRPPQPPMSPPGHPPFDPGRSKPPIPPELKAQLDALDARVAELAEAGRHMARAPENSAEFLAIEQELRRAVQHQFELRGQVRLAEAERLELEAKRIRAGLEVRAQDRDEIIERRMRQLLRPPPPGR